MSTVQNQSPPRPAALAAVLLCVAFGANASAIKICLTGLGGFTQAAARFAVAAVVIAAWARLTGRPFALRPGQARQLLVVGVLFTAQVALFYTAMTLTNASRATLLANLQPFCVLFLAHFLIPGDRITWRKMAGISLGFAGVVVMFASREGVTDAVRTGDLIILGAVALWSLNAVYIKRIIGAYQPFQLTLYPMIGMAPVLLVLALLLDEPMVGTLTPAVVVAFLYQSLVTASFGFLAWNTMQQRYGVVAMHSYIFIIPISGVVFGGLLLGEPVATGTMIAALALVVTGVAVVQTRGPVPSTHMTGRP